MVFALLALFVGALLVAAAFSAANGDIKLTHRATLQQKAYYAAVAGVDRYQYQLTSSSEYWTKCPALGTEAKPLEVTGTTDEGYFVKTLGANGHASCESGKQATILETSGAAKGTFRILSTGTVKEGRNTVTRKVVATFSHPGFTKYVYESNYEVEDPVNYGLEPSVCEHYYAYRKEHNLISKCPAIEFAPEDQVNGPMHTNDAADVCASGGSAPTFGREGYNDAIEMNGGHYAEGFGCANSPDILGTYTESAGSVLPPATDAELLEAAGLKYEGRTEIELKEGSPNTMLVKHDGKSPETVSFPSNGVVYVTNSKSEACAVTSYTPFGTDMTDDGGCGNVYVHGKYTESLTIASADDVIVNGDLTTTTVNNELAGEPTGAATLGLIAENFVRVYHPVKQGYTTTHTSPATGTALNGKCVTKKELSATISRSTEVTGINTTGLTSGDEIEGPSGRIEPGTTITKVESGNRIKLSKAAKPIAKEVNGNILRSTEITGINTTGLAVGQEVEGSAGQFESGTTISKIEAGNRIKVSKAAKPSAKEVTGKTTKNSTEVTNISTTELAVGDEVEGGHVESGTTITEIKSGNKIKLSNAVSRSESSARLTFYGETTALRVYASETVTLIVYVPTGYEYNSTLNNCHKVESGYSEYRESENLYVVRCESGTTYEGEAFCKYKNDSSGCSEKATNLNAGEDPNGWGAIGNPVIDAAILSTNHSWIVDNYKCGAKLGTLTVWGSIAQFWRGPVGTSGSGGTGYIKNYDYDERLADQQPPSFLSPTSASSWKVTRETAPPSNFTG